MMVTWGRDSTWPVASIRTGATAVGTAVNAVATTIAYHDPYVPSIRIDGGILSNEALTEDWLSGADCVVIVTDHSDFDYDWIVAQSQLVVDTRNATKNVEDQTKVVGL